MKLIYLKSELKCDSFDVAIGIKIPFFWFWLLLSRVAPYYSCYHELFESHAVQTKKNVFFFFSNHSTPNGVCIGLEKLIFWERLNRFHKKKSDFSDYFSETETHSDQF